MFILALSEGSNVTIVLFIISMITSLWVAYKEVKQKAFKAEFKAEVLKEVKELYDPQIKDISDKQVADDKENSVTANSVKSIHHRLGDFSRDVKENLGKMEKHLKDEIKEVKSDYKEDIKEVKGTVKDLQESKQDKK